jgi:fatty-acid desaturase
MHLVQGSDRIISNQLSDPVLGHIRWSPVKSLWTGSMMFAMISLGAVYFSWGALILFIITSGITLCAGHSVGMHRRLIHNSFECPLWLEYLFVYLGVLVGMAGPIGMIRMHDMRDWAQRQPNCHDYFGHRAPLLIDAWHQMHCDLILKNSPEFRLEDRIIRDRFYLFLERSWMIQQLPLAILFFVLGGLPWVVWGICTRVTVCVTGHWFIGHFAHRQGEQSWIVEGAHIQGYDIRLAGLISMGESWHNNHHAFPGSAKLGLEPDQPDLGWNFILVLKNLGLAWNLVLPENLPNRPSLRRIRTNVSVPTSNQSAKG